MSTSFGFIPLADEHGVCR